MCCSTTKWLGVVGLMIVGIVVGGCSLRTNDDPWASAGKKPKVLVSFPPLHSFASAVAGEDAVVKCLSTTGVHGDSDATPAKLQLARGCDVFVINGLRLEGPIVSKLEQSCGNPKWKVLDLGGPLKADKKGKWILQGVCRHDHGDDQPHDHTDPHIWLGIRHAKKMTESIRDELKSLDPDHAEGYDRRASEYLARLDKLHEDGKALLKDKKERSILSFHDSLNYFAESYGIDIVDVIEINPGVEPSSEQLKELIATCQKEKLRVIAVEPQYPSKTSAKVIRDALRGGKPMIDAEFVEVDPLETADERELGPELYERKMRENLANLAKVLR